MSSKVVVLIGMLVLVATVAAADTISSTYIHSTQTWEYTVSFTGPETSAFRVYLDPNMSIDYLADITNELPTYWNSPGSLGTYYWSAGGINLKYLEWTRTGTPWMAGTPVVFSYDDAQYNTDPVHIMDLVNHPGPLLYNPPSYAGAPSAETLGGTSPTGQESGHWVAITPEPATMTLLGLGLIGIAGFVRRRRSA